MVSPSSLMKVASTLRPETSVHTRVVAAEAVITLHAKAHKAKKH